MQCSPLTYSWNTDTYWKSSRVSNTATLYYIKNVFLFLHVLFTCPFRWNMSTGKRTALMQCIEHVLSTYRCFTNTLWRTLHEDDLHPFHPQPVQNLHTGDSAMRLEFCHWLHTNRQLLPLILFTDEATFTRNGINNTRNSHRWSHDNPHGTVETNFQPLFLWMCGTVWSMTCWLVPLF